MASRRKSWAEKLADSKGLPQVAKITGKSRARFGASPGDTMVVPAPMEVDALRKRIPAGKLATLQELRQALAKQHGVTMACPLTTGIFAWIAAHAAEEARDKGMRDITPYWRTLKTGGEINPKFPGGPLAISKSLRAEGHKITRRGIRYFVADYQNAIASFA